MKKYLICFILALPLALFSQNPIREIYKPKGDVSCVKVYSQYYDIKFDEIVYRDKNLQKIIYYDKDGRVTQIKDESRSSDYLELEYISECDRLTCINLWSGKDISGKDYLFAKIRFFYDNNKVSAKVYNHYGDVGCEFEKFNEILEYGSWRILTWGNFHEWLYATIMHKQIKSVEPKDEDIRIKRDANNRIIRRQNITTAANATKYNPKGTVNFSYQYKYNDKGQLVELFKEDKKSQVVAYSLVGALFNLPKLSDKDRQDMVSKEYTTFSYDDKGNLIEEVRFYNHQRFIYEYTYGDFSSIYNMTYTQKKQYIADSIAKQKAIEKAQKEAKRQQILAQAKAVEDSILLYQAAIDSIDHDLSILDLMAKEISQVWQAYKQKFQEKDRDARVKKIESFNPETGEIQVQFKGDKQLKTFHLCLVFQDRLYSDMKREHFVMEDTYGLTFIEKVGEEILVHSLEKKKSNIEAYLTISSYMSENENGTYNKVISFKQEYNKLEDEKYNLNTEKSRLESKAKQLQQEAQKYK